MSYKHEIKVIFEDGDFLYTTINGSKEDVRSYYIGKSFNCGTVEDKMKKCVDVEFLNWEGFNMTCNYFEYRDDRRKWNICKTWWSKWND